jgi:hypothetical protein
MIAFGFACGMPECAVGEIMTALNMSAAIALLTSLDHPFVIVASLVRVRDISA